MLTPTPPICEDLGEAAVWDAGATQKRAGSLGGGSLRIKGWRKLLGPKSSERSVHIFDQGNMRFLDV